MFERFTEQARRTLFFARYKASRLGVPSIETEHLLLGLIREGKGLTSRIFAQSHLSLRDQGATARPIALSASPLRSAAAV
jgi:ATP-dependent Clp protease ATP-binding subunit ClpC